MVTQLDIDTKRRLSHARTFVGVMLFFTMVGLADSSLVSTIVIATNAGIWLTWFINKTAALREMSLLEHGDL